MKDTQIFKKKKKPKDNRHLLFILDVMLVVIPFAVPHATTPAAIICILRILFDFKDWLKNVGGEN